MMIQAVLFDLDETLVVETVSVEAAFRATCELACVSYRRCWRRCKGTDTLRRKFSTKGTHDP